MSVLPQTNKYGFYEIRLESIGGLGANLAGKMLSDIGQKSLGLNIASFSSYGSEKKGSPVKAFIRFADEDVEIKATAPIENPHVLIIFSDILLSMPDVISGCTEETLVIVNTRKSHDEIMKILDFPSCKLGIVNAVDIAFEEGVKSNGVLLGALSKVLDILSKESLEDVFRNGIGKKYPALLDANLRAIQKGYDSIVLKEMKGSAKEFKPFLRASDTGIGYHNMVRGGVIPNVGNAANKTNAGGRYGAMPFFNLDKCINCGMCNIVCSDQCIVWEEGIDKKTQKTAMNMAGIDYQYCKGCLKCVEICPVKALTEERESEYNVADFTKDVFNKKNMVQNQK